MLSPDEVERLAAGLYSVRPAEADSNFMLLEGFSAVVNALAQVCERLDVLIKAEPTDERGGREER